MGDLTKNFSQCEFLYAGCGIVPKRVARNIEKLASNLQVLRDYVDSPIEVNSGYRSKKYNASVGGVPRSQHLTGKAADIVVKSKKPKTVKKIIEILISEGLMEKGGIGLYSTFVHYDIRGRNARWSGSK